MYSNFIENIIRNFTMDYAYDEEDIVDCVEHGSCEVFITTTRGERFLYNYLFHTIRNLPPDSNNLSKEECLSEFGIRLRNMMAIKGVSQSTLSELTDISQAMISKYMSGRAAPTFHNVDKIAKALNCSVDDFRYF